MVRRLRLPFALKTTDSGLEPVSESESSVVALARTEPSIEEKMSYALARVPIPFWCVQISEHEAIILSAIRDEPTVFEFTNDKELGTIKRVVGSEMDSWQTIPNAVDRILPLLGSIEKEVKYLKGLIDPAVILSVGNHFVQQEGQTSGGILNEIIDSHVALDASEEFQQILDSRRARLQSLREIQQLAEKTLESETKKLNNLIQKEKERTEERTRNLRDIVDMEISMLKEKQSDQLQELEQEETMDLRALTADFARSTNELETFFSQNILETIRDRRSKIARSKEDVESATSHFEELSNYLEENVPKYEETVSKLNTEAKEVLVREKEIRESYEDKRKKLEEEINMQIRNHQHRIVEFELERDQTENELLEAKSRLDQASENLRGKIEGRVQQLKEELQSLEKFAFKSVNIPGLAPLTKLNVEVFLHNQDDHLEVMTPCIIPKEGIGFGLECEHADHHLSTFLTEMITERIDSSMSFANEINQACISQNLFMIDKMNQSIKEGTDQLHQSGLLESHKKSAFTKRFSLRAGKCPYCGAEIAESVRFCGECGKPLQ
ncbi:MAG: zinc-ribbon domain-containing protein [Candidatus Thorarchaeota archaeon]|nr:zinc-ribbon domain-containing protein [Candidatus Thorarchaeota archaeon]